MVTIAGKAAATAAELATADPAAALLVATAADAPLAVDAVTAADEAATAADATAVLAMLATITEDADASYMELTSATVSLTAFGSVVG